MHYAIALPLLFLSGTAAAQSYSPGDEALRLFNLYKPDIERTEQVHIESPKVLTGDLNGDRRTDALVFFVKYPPNGGNAVLGEDAAVYLNTGKGMKVAGAAPSDGLDCWIPQAIRNGVVYCNVFECAPPYFTKQTGTVKLRWWGGRLVRF